MVTVADTWEVINGEGHAEPGWHARRIRMGSVCDIRASVRAPDCAVAVLFEIAARSVPPGADMPGCVGFELMVEPIDPGPNGRVRICLVLRDQRYRDVFATLAEDVVGVVSAASSEPQAVKLLLGRLHTWERFISRFGPDRLSDERQIGLYAELRFLSDEVIPLSSAAAVVRAWRGPFMEAQDFHFRAVGVEVKSTASRNPTTFHVSNFDQLDNGSLEDLLVFYASVEADALAGDSLPQLVAAIRTTLSSSDPAAASEFDAALIEAGYLDAHAAHYDRVFRVRQILWLKVEEGFPRLIRSTVPHGISAASYSVSLDACAPYAISAEEARQIIRAGL